MVEVLSRRCELVVVDGDGVALTIVPFLSSLPTPPDRWSFHSGQEGLEVVLEWEHFQPSHVRFAAECVVGLAREVHDFFVAGVEGE